MTEETVDVVATSTLTVPLVEPLPGEEVEGVIANGLVADSKNATFHFLIEPAEEFKNHRSISDYVGNIAAELQRIFGFSKVRREDEQLGFCSLFAYNSLDNFIAYNFL